MTVTSRVVFPEPLEGVIEGKSQPVTSSTYSKTSTGMAGLTTEEIQEFCDEADAEGFSAGAIVVKRTNHTKTPADVYNWGIVKGLNKSMRRGEYFGPLDVVFLSNVWNVSERRIETLWTDEVWIIQAAPDEDELKFLNEDILRRAQGY